jgi:hypothetical protein
VRLCCAGQVYKVRVGCWVLSGLHYFGAPMVHHGLNL